MRIALQLGLNVEYKRGLDSFYQGMIDGLGQVDAENAYRLFSYFFTDYETKRRALPQPPRANFEQAVKKWPSSLVDRLERLGVPVIDRLFVRRERCDVFHGLGSMLPRVSGVKTVVTVHDLMPAVFHEQAIAQGRAPEHFPVEFIGDSARRADRVIATSAGTRDDLVRIYGIDPKKIDVVLYGVDEAVFRPADAPARLAAVRERYGLKEPFVLFLGPFQERHNAERVLDAIAELRRERLGLGLRLVFVGKPNASLERVEARAKSLGLGADVRRLGYVPGEDLPPLYESAFAVAHPTTYGGGLPAYESIACGAALITSNTPESTMPEIVEDGALTVDPFDVRSIAGALAQLLREPEFGLRLRAKAAARGRKLTWREAARKYVRIYEELASGATRPAATGTTPASS